MFYRTLQAKAADSFLLFSNQNKQQKHVYINHLYNAMFNEQ